MNTTKLTIVAARLKKSLRTEEVTRIGRESGFTERLREVTPIRVAIALVSCFASQRVESIADILRAFNALSDRSVQYKPFHNQLSKDEFPRFMKQVFQRLLREMVLQVLEPLPDTALAAFSDIIIQDGSSFSVADGLEHRFPGRFPGQPAAVELHATMSVMRDQVLRVALSPDRQGERDFLPKPETLTGKLLLGDRGYFDLDYARRVTESGGGFVLRSKTDINPRVEACWVGGKKRRSLAGDPLQATMERLGAKSADFDVIWDRRPPRFRARLVAIWNPATEEHLFLVTNLLREAFPPEAVATLYRLRWQVELLFKEWKSYANLHAFQTEKAPIAEGLIWASLAGALVKRFLAQAVEYVFRSAATSTRRTAMALSYHLPRVLAALLHGRGVVHRLRELLKFLIANGCRAHPQRDRLSGRLAAGLRHAQLLEVTA